MIGIVLIGHENIAREMRKALEHVVGEQPLIETLNVNDSNQPEQLSQQLERKIRQCDTGDGVLLLADMFGGTPCNIAMGCLQKGRVEVVSGFNLPLLIKAATLRNNSQDLTSFAHQVVEAGQKYMCMAPHVTDARASNA